MTLKAFFNSNSSEIVEVIIFTNFYNDYDLDGELYQLKHNETLKEFSRFINQCTTKKLTLGLVNIKKGDNSIHDRRIYANNYQLYSGCGFGGSGSKGFLEINKENRFNKEHEKYIATKDNKLQFKNDNFQPQGLSSGELIINDLRKRVRNGYKNGEGFKFCDMVP